MTNIEPVETDRRRYHRAMRVFYAVSMPAFALMACYSLFRALRGDADSYPNEHLRSFSLAGALSLHMAHDFVRSKGARWTVHGGSVFLLALGIWLTSLSAPINWGTGAAALLAVIGLLILARALWPARGIPREESDAAPMTPSELRAVGLGMAAFLLGVNLTLLSLVKLRGAPWEAIAVVAATTTLSTVGAIYVLRLRRRIGVAERNNAG